MWGVCQEAGDECACGVRPDEVPPSGPAPLGPQRAPGGHRASDSLMLYLHTFSCPDSQQALLFTTIIFNLFVMLIQRIVNI